MNATNKRSLRDMLIVWLLGFLAGVAPMLWTSPRPDPLRECLTAAQTPLITMAASLGLERWCEFLGDMATSNVRSRENRIPTARILELTDTAGMSAADQQVLDDIAMEIYATTWDMKTARREIEARCLAKAPR